MAFGKKKVVKKVKRSVTDELGKSSEVEEDIEEEVDAHDEEAAPALEEASTTEAPAPKVCLLHGKFLVKNTKKVTICGQMTRLSAGDIIEGSSYGDTAMKGLIEQGVELEAVK